MQERVNVLRKDMEERKKIRNEYVKMNWKEGVDEKKKVVVAVARGGLLQKGFDN